MQRNLLLSVDYTNGGDFYFDSYIKNKVYSIDSKNLHKEIAKILADEGAEILYKNKPVANVFIDDNDGNPKIVGYKLDKDYRVIVSGCGMDMVFSVLSNFNYAISEIIDGKRTDNYSKYFFDANNYQLL